MGLVISGLVDVMQLVVIWICEIGHNVTYDYLSDNNIEGK